MINLTPNQEKKKLIKDFYMRLIIVFFFSLGIAILFSTLALVPAYILARQNINIEKKNMANIKQIQNSKIDEKTLSNIGKLNSRLTIIEKSKNKDFTISEKIVNDIILKKNSNIKIDKFNFEENIESGKTLKIEGLANTREKLLAYRKSFENDPRFSKVDLPITSFIKSTDIKFNLTLILKK